MLTISVEEYQAAMHFASGVNHAGEVRGLHGSFRFVGITATTVNDDLLAQLELDAPYAYRLDCPSYNGGFMSRHRLFVDSGAFSEVEFGPAGPRVVAEITHDDWMERFALYQWVAERFAEFAYLVATDRVGDQVKTLELLARYAGAMRWFAALGANIIVPVQKGDLPMSEMFRRACDILRVRSPIAGIPLKKDATSIKDLVELVESTGPAPRFHLLGLGPESPRFMVVVEAIRSRRPDATITSDSVTIRRLVGRTNGPGGGPRILTRYQDEARARGGSPIGVKAEALFYQGNDELDAWSGDDLGLERRSDIRCGLYTLAPNPQLSLFGDVTEAA